jgi:aspartyl/asparaginyl-tRNA synthetase
VADKYGIYIDFSKYRTCHKSGWFMTLGRLVGAIYGAAHHDEACPFPTGSKMAMDIQ